ncbi:methyltransferase [Spirochaeta dissipatitropha]
MNTDITRLLRKLLVGLHVFVGIGAVGGGIAALLDPTGTAIGIDPSLLRNSPFTSFFIPGLFLLLVLGFGSIASGLILRCCPDRRGGLVSLAASIVLLAWILIQAAILGADNVIWLHFVYFFFGFFGSIAALYWLWQLPEPEDCIVLQHAPTGYFVSGQPRHLLMAFLMSSGAIYLAGPALNTGSFMGLTDQSWMYLMIAVVLTHQLIVALVFRAQLMYQVLSRIFGSLDLLVWGFVFLPLLALRPLTLVGLSRASDTGIGIPRWISLPLGLLLLIPGLYALWSVFRHFGLQRALGGDHFRRRFLDMPMVRAGIFRFSSNAMYTFAFLLLWAIALLLDSRAALAGAAFQHAYIWVHWYCTEEPDMRLLYG